MQKYCRQLSLRCSSRPANFLFPHPRHASLTGAINRGIRKTQREVDTVFEGGRPRRDDGAQDGGSEMPTWQAMKERRLERTGGRGQRFEEKRPEAYRNTSTEGGSFDRPRKQRNEERGGPGSYAGSSFSDRKSRDSPSYNRGDGNNRYGRNSRPDTRPSLFKDRDNAERRKRYENQDGRSKLLLSGPSDGLTRAKKRKAMFGEPYSGQPHHDTEFMENHRKSFKRNDDAEHTSGYEKRPSSPYSKPRQSDPLEDLAEELEGEGGNEIRPQKRVWEQRIARIERPDRKFGQRSRFSSQSEDRSDRFENRGGQDNNDEEFSSRKSHDKKLERGLGEKPRFSPSSERRYGRYENNRRDDLDRETHDSSLESRRREFKSTRKIEKPSALDPKISNVAPTAVPYTTSASEFLFGTFSVQEAIRASRRKLYTLYIYRGRDPDSETGPTTPENYHAVYKLALARGIKVTECSGEYWSRLLNKMTSSRPHNGYVLEASSIPKLPITSLLPMPDPAATLPLALDHQSAEQLTINASLVSLDNTNSTIPSIGHPTRFPLILLLDRITDPGNLGAIVRTAHFLGVDALLVLEHGTAPFNAITLKVAAGAAEYLPILTVRNEHDLVKKSKENGWRFFAAVSPESESAGVGLSAGNVGWKAKQKDMQTALSRSPCVLMLGSEGEGLRPHLQRLADGVASIENARGEVAGVDSLNVSVAAAVLVREFLRDPGPVMRRAEEEKVEETAVNEQIEEVEEESEVERLF